MREVLIGQIDYTVLVKIVGTDGAPETGLTEASIDLAYSRVETDNDVTISDVTPAALAALTDAHTDWGFEEVDSTNAPGLYRLDIADAVFASGAWEAVVTITDASGTDFYPVDILFRLVANDMQVALATAAALATVDSNVDAAKENTDYPDGYVYFSSFFGSAGTTAGVNGTWRNPVSSLANALTLANTIGGGIKFMPNSAATAAGSLANRVIDVHGGALTVDAAHSLSGTLIYSTGRRGNLYGTALAQVTTSNTFLENLYVSGVIATAATLEMRHCGLSGNVTDSTGGPNASFRPLLIDCYNFKGDGSAVTFNLSSGGHWSLQGWYGHLEITNMAAGQVFYANGWGKLTIAASCTGGTIQHSSHIEIVDNASGAVTTELISEPTPWNAAWDAEVQSECTDALNAYDPPTNAEMEARTLVAASYATASALDAVDNFVDTEIAAIQTTLAALFTTALAESYRADGATGTVAQLLYEINQTLGERSISGTAVTVKKVDGSTTAFSQTLNDASTPTSITHAA